MKLDKEQLERAWAQIFYQRHNRKYANLRPTELGLRLDVITDIDSRSWYVPVTPEVINWFLEMTYEHGDQDAINWIEEVITETHVLMHDKAHRDYLLERRNNLNATMKERLEWHKRLKQHDADRGFHHN